MDSRLYKHSHGGQGLHVSNFIFPSDYGTDFMEWTSSQVSRSVSLSHPTLTVSNRKSTALNISLIFFAPQSGGCLVEGCGVFNKRFKYFSYYLHFAQTLFYRKAEIGLSPS